MKILIVDDSSRMRQLIIKLLQGTGEHILIECDDGSRALAEYIRVKPDIVLMDINMKQMNGLDAASRIITLFPAAPIIIITNYNDDLFRHKARLLGIKHYVLKENLTSLYEIINTYHTHTETK